LGRIGTTRKTGDESFRSSSNTLPFNALDFWRWSASDLVSNTTRGRLAEFIVAKAVGISTDGVRDEWAPYDLHTDNGIRIEVKSAAYLQAWPQKQLSSISFIVTKSRTWDPETAELSTLPNRCSDVYVFALLKHEDKVTLDPMNLDQWRFYVLPTRVLNERTRSQHSITLASLNKLNAGPFGFFELATAVQAADERPRT
jgi:hypothetical protein